MIRSTNLKTPMNMANNLQMCLRERYRDITSVLTREETALLACKLWSDAALNVTELESIQICTTSVEAASQLAQIVYARGENCIKSLVNALRSINKIQLAETLLPSASKKPLFEKFQFGGGLSLTKTTTVTKEDAELCPKLREATKSIAKRLSIAETDSIITRLQTFTHIGIDYTHLKDVKGPYPKAVALIETLLEKEDEPLIKDFLKVLWDINRRELSFMVTHPISPCTPEFAAMRADFFAAPAINSGVYAIDTMRKVVDMACSVGVIRLSKIPMGTGFCTGMKQHKYVMTCYHVYITCKEGLQVGEVDICFADRCGSTDQSFALRTCVAEDEDYDYAIIELEEADTTPQPLICCSQEFETLYSREDEARLSIVGYCGQHRTVDMAVNRPLSMEVGPYIKMVKQEVYDKHLKYRKYLSEYDGVIDTSKSALFYHVHRHKYGTSGSPILFINGDQDVRVVALHTGSAPHFYYNSSYADRELPVEYTLDIGRRMSTIGEDLLEREATDIFKKIFIDNETTSPISSN